MLMIITLQIYCSVLVAAASLAHLHIIDNLFKKTQIAKNNLISRVSIQYYCRWETTWLRKNDKVSLIQMTHNFTCKQLGKNTNEKTFLNRGYYKLYCLFLYSSAIPAATLISLFFFILPSYFSVKILTFFIIFERRKAREWWLRENEL